MCSGWCAMLLQCFLQHITVYMWAKSSFLVSSDQSAFFHMFAGFPIFYLVFFQQWLPTLLWRKVFLILFSKCMTRSCHFSKIFYLSYWSFRVTTGLPSLIINLLNQLQSFGGVLYNGRFTKSLLGILFCNPAPFYASPCWCVPWSS